VLFLEVQVTNMKLITEIFENVSLITEDAENGGSKNYFIEGIFMQANVKNKNGRVYPVDILSREVKRYNESYINENRAYGELGHPTGPTINLERVSHMIKSLYQDGNNFIGRAKIIDTPYGQIVKNLMNEGAKLGVSSRGMGSLTANRSGAAEVQPDFYLATAADIVADPSAPNAFVEGIMEGREWIYENGMFREVDLANARRLVHKTVSREDREAVFVKIFERFLHKL